ncbi:protease inhibitor Kazal-type [Nitrosopumilus sp.]|uniref:protease inhibitor Kazal-type n=1 Tax=Nitrosopumilus sp. TaxID=2024843 RepID=UPI002615A5B1|nr:protease inhibitor Kazal-type [Nitrosopumilus sp.]
MDRAGIIVSLVVVAMALGFLATGGTGVPADIPVTLERTTEPIKEVSKETSEKIQELSKSGTEAIEKVTDKTKQAAKEVKEIGEEVKEYTTSKLPSRLVSIPAGTSVPGCEDVDKCYDPSTVIIFKGGEIIWRNDDSSAHTVSSGNIVNGPDNLFDSGLILSDETFSHKFEKVGKYDYFCMIHPWAKASVIVK